MKKSNFATAITAIAVAVVVPIALAQSVSAPSIMGGDRTSWAHEYGGIWALILLVLGFVGLAAWIVKQEPDERIANEKVLQQRTICSKRSDRLDSAGEDHSAG